MRGRDHAVLSLNAAGIESRTLELAAQPDDVARACEELLGPVLDQAAGAGVTADDSVEELKKSKGQLVHPVGPVEEQTSESLREYAASVFRNAQSLFGALSASDEAMLAGSAAQALRLAWMAGHMIAEPRAQVPTTPNDEAVKARTAHEEKMAKEYGVRQASPEVVRQLVLAEQIASARQDALAQAMATTWADEPDVRAASVALLDAAAAVQATAADYFARAKDDRPPTWPAPLHRVELRSFVGERPDFEAFAGGGRAELRWQADCVREIVTLPHKQRDSAKFA
jgi:hypothetical protein